MTRIKLDEAAFNEAMARPFASAVNKKNAALGRAGEPAIVKEFIKRLGVPDAQYIREGNPIPQYIKSRYCHDGCVFDGDKLIAVIEAKMDFRKAVVISSNGRYTTEVDTLEYCIENDIPYYLAIGRHIEGMEGEYVGSVRLTQKHIDSSSWKDYGYEFDTTRLKLK